MVLLFIEHCFVVKPNARILTVWFTSTKKTQNTPVVFIFTMEAVLVGEKILRCLEMKM